MTKKSNIGLILIASVLILGALFLFATSQFKDNMQGDDQNTHQHEDLEKSADAHAIDEEAYLKPVNVMTVRDTLDESTIINGTSMGDQESPVIIREFSSYTCGHCGSFHQNSFKAIKVKYVNSGKVRVIFSDFPLNRPALTASVLSQCLPPERFFGFMNVLFKKQDAWAYEQNYLPYLSQLAQSSGVSRDAIDACLADEEKQVQVAENMETVQQFYEVNSTPTFVIYHKDDPANYTKISGAQKFEVFQKVIEQYLSKN